MTPSRLIGLALVVGGIVLLVMGIRATDSFASQFSKFFTGNPTDRAMWLIIGGVAAMVVGVAAGALPARGAAR